MNKLEVKDMAGDQSLVKSCLEIKQLAQHRKGLQLTGFYIIPLNTHIVV